MEDEQNICPICGSELSEKVIEYSDWNNNHLVVVRDVPVRECKENGHRFFQARVARSLEKLLAAEKQETVQPVELLQVPVFKLEIVWFCFIDGWLEKSALQRKSIQWFLITAGFPPLYLSVASERKTAVFHFPTHKTNPV